MIHCSLQTKTNKKAMLIISLLYVRDKLPNVNQAVVVVIVYSWRLDISSTCSTSSRDLDTRLAMLRPIGVCFGRIFIHLTYLVDTHQISNHTRRSAV